jgi:hypothetical protein
MNTPATNRGGKSPMPQPQMPTVNNVPAPRGANFQDQAWAEEAARAAQRHFDMAAEIVRLTQELEDWRRRALGAESDIKRAEIREAHLTEQVEAKTTQLTQERDIFKEVIIKISTQFGTASQIILDAHKLMDEVLGRKAQINLGALADAIEGSSPPPAADEPPLPSVVRAGPRVGGD